MHLAGVKVFLNNTKDNILTNTVYNNTEEGITTKLSITESDFNRTTNKSQVYDLTTINVYFY